MSEDASRIPVEVRAAPKWVVADGEKQPFNARTGRPASVTNPSDWSSFDAARQYKNAKAHGGRIRHVGFVLSDHDPFTILDIDVKDGKSLTPFQQSVLDAFPSYTERSQSERGYHIVIKGSLSGAGINDQDQGVEIYSTGRYMIFTGDVARDLPIADCQKQLDALAAHLRKDDPKRLTEALVEDGEEVLSDDDLVEKALNAADGEKFRGLFLDGDWEGLGYPSRSEAEFALTSLLAFWTRNNDQLRRLFARSAFGERGKSMRNLPGGVAKIRARKQEEENQDVSALVEQAKALAEEAQATLAEVEEVEEPEEPPPVALAPPRGIVGDLARYIHDSSIRPVPEVALVASIGLVTGICGRQWNTPGEPTGLNLYLILLAQTGTGKEGGRDGIDRILAEVKKEVPNVEAEFKGPTSFSSGPALILALDSQPCFFSTWGEFGKTLHRISNDRAASHEQTLLRALLDVYSRSGQGKSIGVNAYAQVERNTKDAKAPAITIIGDSTPECFFGALTESSISDGLVPRLVVTQYKGPRPRRNLNAGGLPPPDLVNRLATLASLAIRWSGEWRHCQVQLSDGARAVLDAFDQEADDLINLRVTDVHSQLWNRAHLNALKLASVIAVGVNPSNTVIEEEDARWAIDFIRRSVATVLGPFSKGEVGGNDASKTEALVIEHINRFFKMSATKRAKDPSIPDGARVGMAVPFSYLKDKANRSPLFAGRDSLLETVLRKMVKSDLLNQLSPEVAKKQFKARSTPYYVKGSEWRNT